MKSTPEKKTLVDRLRQKAEVLLRNKVPPPTSGITHADVIRMAQELEVQKVELELQAEELRIARLSAGMASDLYDNAPTGYFTLSLLGTIKGLNFSGANLFHQSRSVLKGKKFNDFVVGESKPVFANFLHQVTNNNTKECCEITLHTPGHPDMRVYLTGTMEKSLEFCMVTAVNLTYRQQKDEEMEQERELYLDLINNQPAGIYRIRVYHPDKWWKNSWYNSTNPPYKMELANDRFCEILGVTRIEFEKNPALIADLILPEDLPEFARKNEEANTGMIPFKWEGRLVIHQKVIWIHLESYPLLQGNGEIQWTGILYDITDQKKLVEDLSESENKYRGLVDNSPDAICIYSRGEIVFVNREGLKLIGATHAGEVIGRKVIDMVHPDYRKLAVERMVRLSGGQNVQPTAEEVFIRLDGSLVEVEVKAMPIIYQREQAVQLIVRDISERKKAEKALQASREEFMDLFENAPVGYHEIDAKGQIVRMNRTGAELLGYSKEELMGRYIWDIISDTAYSMQITLEKLKGNQLSPVPYERNFIKKDGTEITVLVLDKILYSPDGTNITGLRTSLQDITERKKAEVSLQNSEEKFRTIFESSVIGKSMTNLDGNMMVNQAFCQIVGYSREELAHLHWDKITHKDDIEYNNLQRRLILHGEKTSAHWEKRFIHKKGHLVWMDISTFLVRDHAGNPVHFITELFDITERKKSEEALRESEERYKSISENSKNAILVMDVNSKIEWANQYTKELLGYTEKQILEAVSFSKFVDGESKEFVRTNYQAMLDKKTFQQEFQLTLVRSDGEKRICEKFMTNFTDRHGVLKIITILTDVTERIRAEEELKRSEQKHRQIIEMAMDGFWIVDTEGKILDANDSYVRMSGYSKDELLTMQVSDFECIEKTSEVQNHMQQIISQGQDRFETRHRRKNGSIMEVEASVQYQSEPTKILITFIRDITERKLAEKALMESEAKFRKLFDNTPIPIMYVNHNGVITHRNKKFIELLGYDENDVSTLTQWWVKAYPQEADRKSMEGVWNRAIQESTHSHVDIKTEVHKVMCKDGIKRDIIVSCSSFADHYMITFVDITEQKKAERTLSDRKEILRKLLYASVRFIDSREEKMDYQRMTELILEISGAKYGSFNLMEENGDDFITVALLGLSEVQQKGISILGFNPLNRKWKNDPIRAAKISQSIITRFETLHELTGEIIPKKIVQLLEQTFQLGEINVVKITNNNKLIGDFTLFYAKDSTIRNTEIVELFASQLGLFLERNYAKQSLSRSEEKYRYLFANNPQPMWIYDLKTLEFLEVNQAAIHLYGYTREEFRSMTLKDIHLPEDVPSLLEKVHTINNDAHSAGEWRHCKKNGEIIIVDISIVPVISNGRKARHAMMQDITERKQAEQALKDSEDKYRRMIENSNDMIWTLDKDAKFTFLNEKALKTTGLILEDWIGKSFLPLALEGELAMLMNIFVRTMEGESCTYELLLKVDEENILTILTNTSPIIIGGKVEGVVSFGRDITESKKALELLQESEEKFRSIAEQTGDLISIANENGVLEYASPASYTIFQYTPEEMQGHYFSEFLAEESIAVGREAFAWSAVTGKSVSNLELVMKRKDGSHFHGEISGSRFNYSNKNGTQVVIRDISERYKAREELQERMEDLLRFNNLTIDREMIMIQLKKEVNELLYQAGKEKKYKIVTSD